MNSAPDPHAKMHTAPGVCYTLQAFAGIIAVLSVIGFFVTLAEVSSLPEGAGGAGRIIFSGIMFLVGGLAGSAVLVALAEIVRGVARLGEPALQPPSAGAAPPTLAASETGPAGAGAAPATVGLNAAQFAAIQRILEEVRDNVLLTEEERRTKRQRLVAMERRERAAQIQQAVEAGRFQDARAVLLELERRIGGDEETRKLAEYIEAAAGKAEAEDVAAATKQVEDLMSLTSWDRAMQVAEDLIDRHPNSLPAKQLLARIQREKQVHQQEHRNRLYVEIQRHTSRREWQQALAIARQLIAAYPESIEAESLRTQLDTLTKNAEIEHRRELETKYKGLIEERNFAEALALAREVIATYPESPQARVMREQIPHLERHVRADFARRR